MKRDAIIGITGSIAAYRACDIICRLRENNFNVTAVMTKEAVEFVTPLLIQEISANPCYIDMFKPPKSWDVEHISLAQKADLILIAPATANIIGKIANGICDDLLTCVVTASKAPVLIAPAMNTNMYQHRAVEENIKRLKSFGYKFVGPVKGRLACGATGLGHIASTEEIIKEANKLLKNEAA